MQEDEIKKKINDHSNACTPYQLIQSHHDFVISIAKHLISRFPPNVQLDDLMQAGMIGLLEADRKFDQSKGASFKTYAGIRIRGAMLDEIRKGDWTPRSVYRYARQVSSAIRSIENNTKRDPKDSEIAAVLELPLEEYYRKLKDVNSVRLFGFEDLVLKENTPIPPRSIDRGNPLDAVQQAQFKEKMAEKIKTLPEKERMVLALYYDEELNLKEVGEVLGVSESRICQIHASAMLRLQSKLQTLKREP